MATLAVTDIARTGVDIVGVTPDAAGDEFPNDGKTLFLVANASAGSINATLDIKSTVDGATVTDPVVAVAAGVTKAFGPFARSIYNDPATGRAKVTCSATADVTVRALRLTPA